MKALIESKWRKRNQRLLARRPAYRRRVGVGGVESLEERRLLAIVPELNFLGQVGGFNDLTNAVAPPDPILDVGTRHVVHAVNHATFGSSIEIYDKENGQLVRGPIAMSQLAAPAGACAAGIGDPVIAFDHLANRWLAGEFAIGPLGDNHFCIYISNTDDPTQGWLSYDVPTQLFPDYPKLVVWPDAYYVTTNEPVAPPPNVPAVYALDRESMLAGVPMRPAQRFVGPPLLGFGFQSFTASDLDGPAPAPGTPNFVLRQNDDELNGGAIPGSDTIQIWEFHTDFVNPNNSRFQMVQTVSVADFDSNFGPFPQNAIEQPGITDPNFFLDAISPIIMNQLKYRNFGTHETLVGDFTIDVNGADLAGIRWFELRRAPGGQWTLFQEGTIAPGDGHDRWLGSPAMNGDQTIALGYAISSAVLSPASRITGRLRTDPLGIMTQGEFVVANGSGNDPSGRWGDYYSMAVDPIDDFTFWFVGQFANNGGWATQVVKFHIDSPPDPEPPGPPPSSVITGVIFNDIDADGTRDANEPGIDGFIVFADLDEDGRLDLNEPAVRSGAGGRYQLPPLPFDTYNVRQVPPPSWRQTFPAGNAAQVVTIDEDGVDPPSADFGNTGGDLWDFGNDRGMRQTTLADNGARHGVLPGFQLGPTLDGEADAEVDDVNDGVTFPSPLIAGSTTATAIVTITTSGQPRGLLQGFVDFNQDGDWSDAGEQVVTDLRLGTGTHTVTFAIPANALTGPTNARFRYGWERGIGPGGPAMVGEVEDYVVTVFGDAPQAIDDSFVVEQDSINNVLDVLQNDFASSAGDLRILSVTAPNRGGSASVSPDRQTIIYSPAPNFFGTEAFTYTVTDDSGKTSVGRVTIIVEPTFDAPQAVDDQASVSTNSTNSPIRVLDNDILGANPPTRIAAITEGPDFGTATIDANGTVDPSDDVIRYTPDTNFVGVDQFVYRITDSVGASSEATVTVFVGDAFSDDDVRYSLLFTDLNGDPITEIEVGETFVVTVVVADVRTGVPVDEQGVFAAFLDVLYPAQLVSLENGLVFNGEYTAVPEGDTSVPGILDETGAFRQVGELPPGPGNKVVYRAAFRANTTGVATFLTDPADEVLDPGPPPVLGDHDTLIYSPPSAIPIEDITYLSNTISIVSSGEGEALHNFFLANDVNGDARVTPFDALAVIAKIHGFSTLSAEGESVGVPQKGKQYFYDTTNDGQVNIRDILSVVTHLASLQNQKFSEGEGEGAAALGLAPAISAEQLDASIDAVPALPADPLVIHVTAGSEPVGAPAASDAADEPIVTLEAPRSNLMAHDEAIREFTSSDADDESNELEDLLIELVRDQEKAE